MAYGSVHIPAGCTVKIGDTVPTLADLGVLKGDASIGITYDKVKVQGSKAETLIDFIKNMKAAATFELYQLHLPNIEKLFDGAVAVTPTAGGALTDQPEEIAVGSWLFDRVIPLEHQMGTGLAPTINRVAGSVDTTLELTLTTVVAGDTVTINGLTFTAAAATTVANREFKVGVTDADDAVELATCINDTTYGVPGITAAAALAVVTLSVDTPLITGLSASSVGGTIGIVGVDELVLDTDYFLLRAHDGRWGINIVDSGIPVTTVSQVITVDSDYTPAASYTLVMGDASVELTTKIVEFSKTIAGKIFRARLWSVTNEDGLTLAFPDSAGDEPLSLPVSLVGGLDTGKAAGSQLIEIYDEIGVTFP